MQDASGLPGNNGMRRREALRRLAAGLAVAAGAGGHAAWLWPQALLARPPYWVTLNGQPAGWAAVMGGTAKSVGIPLDRGPEGTLPPPPAPQRTIRDLQIRFGRGMTHDFYAWVASCLETAQPAEAAGTVLGYAAGTEVWQRQWTGGYVTALSVPGLDAVRRDAVTLSANVHLANVTASLGDGTAKPAASAPPAWPRLGYRFRIEGAEAITRQVARIAPLVFRRPLATNVLDAQHRNTVRAGAPQWPELGLTLGPEPRAALVRFLRRWPPARGYLELTSADWQPWLRFDFDRLELQPPAADGVVRLRMGAARLAAPA